MSWQVVARKELDDARDSRRTRWLLWLVALTFVAGGYVAPVFGPSAPATGDYASLLAGTVTTVLPLVGLLLGHKTIVGERSSGQLTLLLSLPYTRRSVVVGKFAARGAALAGALVGGGVGGALLVNYPFGSLQVWTLLSYLLATLLYALAFLGVGMAVSTLTTSERAATAGAFGVFFLSAAVWSQLQGVLFLLLDYLGLADGSLPNWALFLYGAEPGMLYRRLVQGFYGGVDSGVYLGPDAPFYLGEWAALVLLGLWALVPVTLGYLRFSSTDL